MSAQDGQLAFDLRPPRLVKRPPAGVIAGGAFDGWAYVLIERRREGTRVYPLVRATPPDWPFPREVLVKPPARLVAR